jgi:hypothetical protein
MTYSLICSGIVGIWQAVIFGIERGVALHGRQFLEEGNQKVISISFLMETSPSPSTYKHFDRAKDLKHGLVGTIFGSNGVAPVLTAIPDPPELGDLVAAVLDLAGQGHDFIPPLSVIFGLIPVNIDKALSPTFLPSAFPEMVLVPLVRSPLFALIRDILDTSDNPFVLAESLNLVISCACASKDGLVSFVKLGFLDLLFSCIPRIFPLSFPWIIFKILTALTIIWKRLSFIGIAATLSMKQLDDVFVITSCTLYLLSTRLWIPRSWTEKPAYYCN